MTLSSGADFSAPGTFSLPLAPWPCGGHGPREAGSGSGPPPGGHSPASHVGDAPGGTQPGAEHELCDG
eukprot:4843068-Prymnesium_polylepis.1